MSAPKHLWSGDWEGDSEAAARERARRRGQLPTPAAEEPPQPSPPLQRRERQPQPERPPAPAEAPKSQRRRPQAGTAILVALAVLVLVAGAYGLTQLGGSDPAPGATVAKSVPYLGVNMETLPINRVMIAAVTPGSPADRAGLGPGDVITAVNSHPVGAPGDVTAAISHLHPGDSVNLRIQRGGLTYSTNATLAAQPPNYP